MFRFAVILITQKMNIVLINVVREPGIHKYLETKSKTISLKDLFIIFEMFED